MPPRAKKPEQTPCEEHFPAGWPDNIEGLGCEHGTWTRQPSPPETSEQE